MRILFVQTHADSARIIGRLLRTAGHEVTIVDSLAGAWEALGAGAHDVIIFGGVEASDGRAWDFMPRVKQTFGRPGIVLSGYGMEEDLRRSEEAGFSAHLIKPTRFEDLIDALNRVGEEMSKV